MEFTQNVFIFFLCVLSLILMGSLLIFAELEWPKWTDTYKPKKAGIVFLVTLVIYGAYLYFTPTKEELITADYDRMKAKSAEVHNCNLGESQCLLQYTEYKKDSIKAYRKYRNTVLEKD